MGCMRIGLVGVGRIGAFHAKTLAALPAVDDIIVTDVDQHRAAAVAADLGLSAAPDVPALLRSGIDALVIATGTNTHGELITASVTAGLPTFCEKPVAGTVEELVRLAELERQHDVPIHIGFQRRFDRGYRRLQAAVASGELGFIHTIRANTHDQSPPEAAYIPTSGGIFRDCNIHDFDILRFVTAGEVARAYASGGNKGDPFFAEAGDVDTGAALLTMVDGTMVLVSSTRYNGAGHDVRMEVHGSTGTMAVGLDHTLAMTSAEDGVDFPHGPVHTSFMERFLPAYVEELTAFADVVAGARPSPCTIADGLQAGRIAEACTISRQQSRPVDLAEIPGAARNKRDR
jgi:myo-inositol 2-dehydrogenase/D-chiro-inositol 1-dehydrogenase